MKCLANPEVLRRLALAAGLVISIMMYTASPGRIYLIQKPDFEEMQQADYKRALRGQALVDRTIAQRPGSVSKQLLEQLKRQQANRKPIQKLPLDEYIAAKTKGKTTPLTGPNRQEALEKIKAHYRGQTPAEWRTNTRIGKSGDLYFPMDQGPFPDLAPELEKETLLTYDNGGSTGYLRLATRPANQARGLRDALRRPWRPYWWAPLAIGLCLYFIIPKVKRPAGAMGYPRLWGVMISDFFSLLFGGLFFLFAFLAISEHNASPAALFNLDRGPLILVFCLGLFGLGCLSVLWLGVSYVNYWIMPLPRGLERRTVAGARLYPYREMNRAWLRIKHLHWLVTLILLLGGNDAGLTLMGLSHRNKIAASVVIDMKDGRSWRIKLAEAETGINLARILKDNGVELDDELTELLEIADREGDS